MKKFILGVLLLPLVANAQLPPLGLTVVGSNSSNPFFYIPYALHIPHPTTCVDGNGMTVSGNAEPDYDTLIGVTNLASTAQTVRFKAYNQSGVVQLWAGVDHKDYALVAGRSVAMTFIPGNVFADSPTNWKGYATVESITGGVIAVTSFLGGGGCYPYHYNSFSAEVPVLAGPLPSRSVVGLGYSIPYYSDFNHSGNQSYRTGLAITNFDTSTVTFRITFRIADFYAGAGNSYTFTKTLNAGTSTSFDMYAELLMVGYVAATNAEGGVKIEALNAFGAPVAVKFGVSALVTNLDDRGFSVGYGL